MNPAQILEEVKRKIDAATVHLQDELKKLGFGVQESKDNLFCYLSALVPKDSFDFSPEINIYDNKVMIASWKEKLGIIIESHEIADAMKKVFELAWAEAKRLNKDLVKKHKEKGPR